MNNRPSGRFLVTDLVPPGCIETLEGLGFAVNHIEDLSNEQLKGMIGDYTGLVVRTSLTMDAEMIDRALQLKYILRPGSGLDNVDVEYAQSKGILIFNSPEANSDAVAEHALGLLLGLMRFIPRANEQVKNGLWIRKPNTGTLLKGKTVAIIGYGNTGTAMAKKLRGFETNLLVYDKYKKGFGDGYVKESDMETIFEQADVLSLHIPLTTESKRLINTDFISRFQKPFYLINTSRGKIVDLKAVIQALHSGRLMGAGLDVLEHEKLSEYEEADQAILNDLYASGNVIITPHIAGWTHESRDNIFYLVLEKFRTYFFGME